MYGSFWPYSPSFWGEGLKNRIFFTWAFVETAAWFWIWVTLREERREWAYKIQLRNMEAEEKLR
jgi:hypothetical protein